MLKKDPVERYLCWNEIISKLENGDIYNETQVIGQKVQVIGNGMEVMGKAVTQLNQQNQAMFSYLKA